MYPLQICAASKNIRLITVAGCHRSLYWKYKLVLCSSEIRNWKLDTSTICTKEKLPKIWDLWSDGEGGKEKKEETSAASPGKGRNKQVQCPTCEGEGKGEKTLRDDSARLRLCRFLPCPLQRFSCHLKAVTKGSPWYLSVSHGDQGGWCWQIVSFFSENCILL